MKSPSRESSRAAVFPDADIRELTSMLYAALSRFQTLRRTFAGMLNLTPSEFAIVMSLHGLDKNKGTRIRELADRIHVAAANCTATVKALERKGWVTKTINPDDSRALSVQLTGRSRGALDNFFRNIHPINQIWFDHVTKSDRASVRKTLGYLIEQYPAALQKARTIKRQRKIGHGVHDKNKAAALNGD
jgi:DNA-binding MarR family transcriptional regulator